MTKKPKPKHFTKKEIAKAKLDGDRRIIHELAGKLMNGELLLLAEMEAASSILGASRPAGSIEKVNLASIPGAQDYIFITLFLAYHGDLDGQYGITKFSGELKIPSRVVPIEEKQEDVIRLKEYYVSWLKLFAKNNHSDQILNLIINEANKDLKEIDRQFNEGTISKEDHEYKRKGTILLSKYLYLRIKRIFEDLGAMELPVNFNGKEIMITPWSMVHILNRHYAKAGKQYDTGKSFHSDENLKFFEDPDDLRNILEQLSSNDRTKVCDLEYFPFKLNGVVYAVHTKKLKTTPPSIRLQTFYPVEEAGERNEILTQYEEVVISANLNGYVKK